MTYDSSKGHPADGFYPANEREREILGCLKGDSLIKYIDLRNSGLTVTQALKQATESDQHDLS